MSNITKQDIVQEIARSTGFIQSDIRGVVEEFLGTVARFLEEGRSIEIRGFGTFSLKDRKPRPARNPRTGEEVYLCERKAPIFKFSSDIKKKINRVDVGLPISNRELTSDAVESQNA